MLLESPPSPLDANEFHGLFEQECLIALGKISILRNPTLFIDVNKVKEVRGKSHFKNIWYFDGGKVYSSQ